jgi:hypothetical protein
MAAWETNRRTFLKLSGAAMLSPQLTSSAAESAFAESFVGASALRNEHDDLLQYVNLLQRTDSTIEFHGGTRCPSSPCHLEWRIGRSSRAGRRAGSSVPMIAACSASAARIS